MIKNVQKESKRSNSEKRKVSKKQQGKSLEAIDNIIIPEKKNKVKKFI